MIPSVVRNFLPVLFKIARVFTLNITNAHYFYPLAFIRFISSTDPDFCFGIPKISFLTKYWSVANAVIEGVGTTVSTRVSHPSNDSVVIVAASLASAVSHRVLLVLCSDRTGSPYLVGILSLAHVCTLCI